MSEADNSYLAVKNVCETKIPVGKCRFITNVGPAKNDYEARVFLSAIRSKYSDATHHVYAYRFGSKQGLTERSSDDREPAGTGGPPVLSAIRKRGLSDTIVVVSRYFGGVKLGVGGLIRAYRAAAEEGLDAVDTEQINPTVALKATVSYSNTGTLMHLISSLRGGIVNTIFDDNVTVEILLPPEHTEIFRNRLKDITRGDYSLTIQR